MNQTTPQSVNEANHGAFTGSMNMITAAEHCGMTFKQFKLTFREFLKYHPPTYEESQSTQLNLF